jgi:hypothetical protein
MVPFYFALRHRSSGRLFARPERWVCVPRDATLFQTRSAAQEMLQEAAERCGIPREQLEVMVVEAREVR